MNYCTCPIENHQDVPDKVCLVCNKPTRSSYLIEGPVTDTKYRSKSLCDVCGHSGFLSCNHETEGPFTDITYSCRRCKYLYHTVDSSGLFTVEKYRCRKLNNSTVPYNLETPKYCPLLVTLEGV